MYVEPTPPPLELLPFFLLQDGRSTGVIAVFFQVGNIKMLLAGELWELTPILPKAAEVEKHYIRASALAVRQLNHG